MDRRSFLSTAGVTGMLALAGCVSSSDDSGSEGSTEEQEEDDGSELQGSTQEDQELVDLQYREWTESEVETVKDEASELEDYGDLARNAEDRAGEYITFTAEVIQNLEGDNYSALLLALDDYAEETVYGSWTGSRYIEGDIVTVWAEVLGIETYQTAGMGQRTVPALAIADIELQEEGA